LVDALWADRPPARPADQVSVLASRVRKVLGRDAVAHGDHGYRLTLPVDLDELDAVVAETERRAGNGETGGAVSAARIALSLIRGAVPDGGADADWAASDHASAARLVLRARRAAAQALLDSGSWAEALDLATADWGADPYEEVAVRIVMRAEVAAGRPARALQAFAELRTILADELGTDPDPATEALHAEVLRGELTSPTRTPARPVLVGRASQLDHLDTLVLRARNGSPRIALVSGEAGIGKTTLLRSWSQARIDAGDTVLSGTCGALDRSAPLDVVLAAVAEHVRRSGDPHALLSDDGALLDPLTGPASLDPALGPATLYAAVTAVLARICADRGAVLVVDDAHLAGPALGDWLEFMARRPLPLLVVLAARPAEGPKLPATDEVRLGPLDLAETGQLVGAERAAELHARSGGHPLFLSELAGAATGDLPDSLVAAVVDRCDQLGDAADVVRAAAALGSDLDVELLAAVLGRPALDVLADIESAADRGLLVERDGRYTFRHELVREALAAGTAESRLALLHREAARVLAARSDADPVQVAEHARRGGEAALAATWLTRAAERASARFDHATAAALLEDALALHADDETLLARARVRIRIGRYREAEEDAVTARADPASGAEVAAWAAYFDRRFDDAVRHATDGELVAADDAGRARSLIAGGRIRHARGDLAGAEARLVEATNLAIGPDRLTAAAWLGVLFAHQSRTTEALDLLRPATSPGVGVDHTSAALHALLFTGHAHAIAGHPLQALAAFERYTGEVDRRQVPRFGGRGVNFGGWVLRNLGATAAGRDAHEQALDLVGVGTTELEVAALEDLAEERLHAGDLDGAVGFLDRARVSLSGDLVFGWRLAMKLRLLDARLSLLRGDPEGAASFAVALRDDAAGAGVPRYASVAALVAHQARAVLGEQVDLDQVSRDLDAVEQSVRLEAGWWAGDTGAALGRPELVARAETMAAELARVSGPHGATLLGEADRRLEGWTVSAR
jgi:DNA-binding SARP family transcriptional activator/tetratricopeptide (TPR) repeat protein